MSNNYDTEETKSRLLAYVSDWFDKCTETGAIDDHCEMGQLTIEMCDAGHWIGPDGDEKKALAVTVTPTFPLEQI